jgi:hypothetical protein
MINLQLQIVDRPTPGETLSLPVTPDGLKQFVLDTADTQKAVRFTISDDIFRAVHNRMFLACRKRNMTLHYTKIRPKHRTHRSKSAPYDVIMWADHKPSTNEPTVARWCASTEGAELE